MPRSAGGTIERIDGFVGNGASFFEVGSAAAGGGSDTTFGLEPLNGLDSGKHSAVAVRDHREQDLVGPA